MGNADAKGIEVVERYSNVFVSVSYMNFVRKIGRKWIEIIEADSATKYFVMTWIWYKYFLFITKTLSIQKNN